MTFIELGEFLERIIEGDDVNFPFGCGSDLVTERECSVRNTSATFFAPESLCVVREHLAHGPTRKSEEMSPCGYLVEPFADLEPYLVNEIRGLKSVMGWLRGEEKSGKSPQFIIDERHQGGGSVLVSLLDSSQESSHFIWFWIVQVAPK